MSAAHIELPRQLQQLRGVHFEQLGFKRRELVLIRLDDTDERSREQANLTEEYDARFGNPYAAAERGYVDVVIDPLDTRRVLVSALAFFRTKRESGPSRRHSNTPL